MGRPPVVGFPDVLVWLSRRYEGLYRPHFFAGHHLSIGSRQAPAQKLLNDKTGHIIITADTPGWYNYLFMHRPAFNQFKKGTLEFCGVGPLKLTYIAPIRKSSEAFRQGWLEQVRPEGASFSGAGVETMGDGRQQTTRTTDEKPRRYLRIRSGHAVG